MPVGLRAVGTNGALDAMATYSILCSSIRLARLGNNAGIADYRASAYMAFITQIFIANNLNQTSKTCEGETMEKLHCVCDCGKEWDEEIESHEIARRSPVPVECPSCGTVRTYYGEMEDGDITTT